MLLQHAWEQRGDAVKEGRKKRLTVAVSCLGLFLLLVWVSYAQTLISLQCWVTYALLQDDNYTPLVDGSIVLIIGSSNNVIDPMNTYGETNYIARSTTGDDQIIGEVTIDSTELGSNGTFYSGDFYFDPDEVKWLYIRFFQETNSALTGMIHWGESLLVSATNYQFGVLWVDFSPDTDHIYYASNYDNFVVIPEPSSTGLMLLAAFLLGGMSAARSKRQEGEGAGRSGN